MIKKVGDIIIHICDGEDVRYKGYIVLSGDATDSKWEMKMYTVTNRFSGTDKEVYSTVQVSGIKICPFCGENLDREYLGFKIQNIKDRVEAGQLSSIITKDSLEYKLLKENKLPLNIAKELEIHTIMAAQLMCRFNNIDDKNISLDEAINILDKCKYTPNTPKNCSKTYIEISNIKE